MHVGLFGYPHAYVSRNGVRTDLGTLAGENRNYSFGFAINNAGQVVGVSTNTKAALEETLTGGTLYYAFLWSNGTMKAIGGAQSSNFAPTAINDNGWIAGTLNVHRLEHIVGRLSSTLTVGSYHSGQSKAFQLVKAFR